MTMKKNLTNKQIADADRNLKLLVRDVRKILDDHNKHHIGSLISKIVFYILERERKLLDGTNNSQ